MMSSPASGSDAQAPVLASDVHTSADPAQTSSAYSLFHPKVQRWIYASGWGQLRDVQERAAGPILAGDRDVIVAAATASGKTEAAWLPICTAILSPDRDRAPADGIKALYVGPLKALINDQYDRLSHLCRELDVPVHRWHGDVAGSRKAQVIRAPDGILLITPESLESLFVNHGDMTGRIFSGLRYAVIDELHSFIGTERGAQLQSLLHRTELAVRRRIPRVALSATLGDFAAAQEFLRPGRAHGVTVISSIDDAGEIRLQLRGYVAADPQRTDPPPRTDNRWNALTEDVDDDAGEADPWDRSAIADHLFRTLRGSDNLVFANSRGMVETFTDILVRRCQDAHVPVEFVPHHGNLSKEIREHVETRLKDRSTPVTAVCTSTLEMGIDIGSVDSIAQIDAPATVAGLRQRLGRSGRRANQPAVLRLYISERELTDRTPPVDQLRTRLVQSIAIIELLLTKWYEPPNLASLHLSTLIQQILSVIAQRGGAQPAALYDALCGQGPFNRVDKATFVSLLRCLGDHDLLTQDSGGLLLAGGLGDRIINHYSFYTAFQTLEEFRLVANGRTLGSLPIEHPVAPGSLLIFGGRRWKVLSVDPQQKVIDLTRSAGGRPPAFSGGGGEVADRVRRTMRQLYTSDQIPAYLDHTAQILLKEGRAAFHRYGYDQHAILDWGADTLLFPWRGDRIMNTLAVVLTSHGHDVGQDGVALTIRGTTPAALQTLIALLATQVPPEPTELADGVRVKATDKHDQYLNGDLLNLAYAANTLDVTGAWATLRALAAQQSPENADVP
jgi:ATP-dependent Lhr-like helicase